MLGFQAYTIPQSALALLSKSASEVLGVQSLQPYLPVYERFFNLDADRRLATCIRSKFLVRELQGPEGDEDARTLCENLWCSEKEPWSGEHATKDVFYKTCPLVDPLDYVLGGVPATDAALELPTGQPTPDAGSIPIT